MKHIPGMTLERVQKIKTEKNRTWHFARVLLVNNSWLSRKVRAYDEDSGEEVTEMQAYDEETCKYRTVDLNSMRGLCWLTGVTYRYKQEPASDQA